ncbi:MAG: RNA polymerase Rpb4 family protein [Halobacteriota archaeon]
MIVKAIINETALTLAEAKELLKITGNKVRKRAEGEVEEGEEEEVRYERRKAIEHTTKFAKLDAEKSRALINDLLALEKMKEEIAVRLADLLPKSKNEVRAVYAKERFTLTEANIDEILDCIVKYE